MVLLSGSLISQLPLLLSAIAEVAGNYTKMFTKSGQRASRERFFGVFFETAVVFLILAAAGMPTAVFRGLLGFFLGVGFLVAAFLGMAVFAFTVFDFFGWARFFGAFAAIFFLVGI